MADSELHEQRVIALTQLSREEFISPLINFTSELFNQEQYLEYIFYFKAQKPIRVTRNNYPKIVRGLMKVGGVDWPLNSQLSTFENLSQILNTLYLIFDEASNVQLTVDTDIKGKLQMDIDKAIKQVPNWSADIEAALAKEEFQ